MWSHLFRATQSAIHWESNTGPFAWASAVVGPRFVARQYVGSFFKETSFPPHASFGALVSARQFSNIKAILTFSNVV